MNACPECSAAHLDTSVGCPHEKADLANNCEPDRVVDGKYRLDRLIGDGAMGAVYQAFHLDLKRPFAVKLLKGRGQSSPTALHRFRREAQALGRLKHPHIVDVTDFGIDAREGPYLVMEYLEGISLADYCRREGPLPLTRALLLLDPIASAIDHAHAKGILHRDLKPGNVLLTTEGASAALVPKILDFGVSQLLDPAGDAQATERVGINQPSDSAAGLAEPAAEGSPPLKPRSDRDQPVSVRLTETGSLLGTPAYVAPELICALEASRASDIYSFGVLLYEVLVGRAPFQGRAGEVLAAHLREEPPDPSTQGVFLPEEVSRALCLPLRKDPALRPKSAAEVLDRIRRAGQAAALARWRAVDVPRRVRIGGFATALLLILWTLLGRTGPLRALERWSQDVRLGMRKERLPDLRILLITVDESSLGAASASLADRADEFGRVLGGVFEAGARGVAIDFLLPSKWSSSEEFSRLVLEHSASLTLSAMSSSGGRVVGTSCVAGLTAAALGPERTSGLFGFVNLDEDSDGMTRQARSSFRDQAGRRRDSFASRAAKTLLDSRAQPDGKSEAGLLVPGTQESFWIDSSIGWRHFDRVSWQDVPAALERSPELFRDRLVLLGGEFLSSGDDYHRIPGRAGAPDAVSGLVLQALIVNTILVGLPIREPMPFPIAAAVALVMGILMVAVLRSLRLEVPVLCLFGFLFFYLAASIPLLDRTGILLPAALPLAIGLSGLGLALLLRFHLPRHPQENPSFP